MIFYTYEWYSQRLYNDVYLKQYEWITLPFFYSHSFFICFNPSVPRGRDPSNPEFGCKVNKVWSKNYSIQKLNSDSPEQSIFCWSARIPFELGDLVYPH
jgi:hypothetical protein